MQNASKNAQNDVQNAPKTSENTLQKLRERLTLFDQALAFAPDDKLALQGKASVLLQMIPQLQGQDHAQDQSKEVALYLQAGREIAIQLGQVKLESQFEALQAASMV